MWKFPFLGFFLPFYTVLSAIYVFPKFENIAVLPDDRVSLRGLRQRRTLSLSLHLVIRKGSTKTVCEHLETAAGKRVLMRHRLNQP